LLVEYFIDKHKIIGGIFSVNNYGPLNEIV